MRLQDHASKLSAAAVRHLLACWNPFSCDSQDLTLQAILSNGVATVRQTLRRMFRAMAAERAKKRHKLVLTPGYINYPTFVSDHPAF
jgi:hypothetical protein